jgi:hypothetical protein
MLYFLKKKIAQEGASINTPQEDSRTLLMIKNMQARNVSRHSSIYSFILATRMHKKGRIMNGILVY